jgi:hypothetical protein
MEDYVQGEFRVMRALVRENSDDAETRMQAIRERFLEAEMARETAWITANSGPDYKAR